MYRVYTSEKIGRIEGVFYRIIGVDPKAEQTWRRYASCVLWFSAIGMVLVYVLMRLQAHLPLNPVGLAGREPVRLVQHRRELHDQHELAGLRRRDHDELPHADARAHVPELRLGGRRHGRADRDDPRVHPVADAESSATSGATLVRSVVYILLPARGDRRGRPDHAGRRADATRTPPSVTRHPGVRADDRARPRRPRRSRSSSSGRTAAGSST